ncbi:MAG: DUF2828 family protein [Lentisphaeria bacterium]|nr:DUF2828 family protein [Lentisphaeria bacterium]
MSLLKALSGKIKRTENGMQTFAGSTNYSVDLFFTIAAVRGADKGRIINMFYKALSEDALSAIRILFWARDVRGGAGERQVFKDILTDAAENFPEFIKPNVGLIPEFGRWDDLFALFGTPLERDALRLIAKGLQEKNGLCAKWMPRQGRIAGKLRAYLKMTPKQYRKMLVALSDVVESAMCAQAWDLIEYSKLPSVAAARYQKAFKRNDGIRYENYKAGLISGKSTINAGAVYPYDITKSLMYGDDKVAVAQWKTLPNYLAGSKDRILPVVDVSGSMMAPAGGNGKVTCLDVAISLGLYISERNFGLFKDAFITFSAMPELQYLKGNLKSRYEQLAHSTWGMNTNIQAVFELILNQALSVGLKAKDMPAKILILSDMEFDVATSSSWGESVPKWDFHAQQKIASMYAKAGYTTPVIVYWNIQSRQDNIPVRYDENGTALISGFSPSIMTSLLSGIEFTPKLVMERTIHADRYKLITI